MAHEQNETTETNAASKKRAAIQMDVPPFTKEQEERIWGMALAAADQRLDAALVTKKQDEQAGFFTRDRLIVGGAVAAGVVLGVGGTMLAQHLTKPASCDTAALPAPPVPLKTK